MTLKEAIEKLQFHYEWLLPLKDPELTEATKLGIEAILYVERNRLGDIINPDALLPGETEEAPRHAHFHEPDLADIDKRGTK